MRPLFLPLSTCVLLVALSAAAPLGAIAAMNARGQAGQDDFGSGKNCVRIMGRVVCKNDSTPAAAAAAVAPAVVAARLFADGPQISPRSDARNFALQGFVRRGWPVAVDFLPQPNTRTFLVVTPYDPEPSRSAARPGRIDATTRARPGHTPPPSGPVRIVIDADGSGGRRLFILPRIEIGPPQGSTGNRPLAIATYTVESYRIRRNGKLAGKRSPVEIFGLGAGPDAVSARTLTMAATEMPPATGIWRSLGGGAAYAPARTVADGRPAPRRLAASFVLAAAAPPPAALSVTQVVLASGKAVLPHPPKAGAPVGYGYSLGRTFDRVAEDIWKECGGYACGSISLRRLDNAAGTQGSRWMLTPKIKPGQYRLRVRAWLLCTNPNFTRCEDQGSFSANNSRLVTVK